MDKLKELRRIFEESASKGTAYQFDYDPQRYGVLHNHCAVVAYVVQKLFGGVIVSGHYRGIEHYWNMLDSGMELDFTSEQFGGDGIYPILFPSHVDVKLKIDPRFRLFEYKVSLDREYPPIKEHLDSIKEHLSVIAQTSLNI